MALRDQLRVMVVDDMTISRGLLVQTLDSFGITQVISADDGQEALETLAKNPVHLVISDYCMPNMDGLHLLHALRSDERTKNIGFIMVSGHADHAVVESGKQMGMNNFLQKPITAQELRSGLEAVVGRL